MSEGGHESGDLRGMTREEQVAELEERENFVGFTFGDSLLNRARAASIGGKLWPSGRMKATVKTLEDEGFSPQKAVEKYPSLLGISPNAITTMCNTLRALNISNYVNILTECPEIFVSSPTTVSRVLEVLGIYGIQNISSLLDNSPAILLASPNSIISLYSTLLTFKFKNDDFITIVEAIPSILLDKHTDIRKKLEYLQSLGLTDFRKVIREYPSLLRFEISRYEETMAILRKKFKQPIDVLDKCPEILLVGDKISERMAYLKRRGINPVKVFQRRPKFLTYTKETISIKIDTLRKLGLNYVSVIERAPAVLGMAAENVEAKYAFLRSVGFSAKRIIDAYPSVLTLSQENIETKVDLFARVIYLYRTDKDMSTTAARTRSIELIEQHPMLLGYAMVKLWTTLRIFQKLRVSPERITKSLVSRIVTENTEEIVLAFQRMRARIRNLPKVIPPEQQMVLQNAFFDELRHVKQQKLSKKKKDELLERYREKNVPDAPDEDVLLYDSTPYEDPETDEEKNELGKVIMTYFRHKKYS